MVTIISKKSIDVWIQVTGEVRLDYEIDYSMMLSFQVKTIVNIATAEVLNTEWNIDELYICAEDV